MRREQRSLRFIAFTFLLCTTNIRNRLRLQMSFFFFSGFFEFFNVDVEARRALTRLGFMQDIRF